MYKKYGNTDDTITFFSKNSHTKEKEWICNMLFILHITTVSSMHTYLTGKKSKQKFFISCPESPGNTFSAPHAGFEIVYFFSFAKCIIYSKASALTG